MKTRRKVQVSRYKAKKVGIHALNLIPWTLHGAFNELSAMSFLRSFLIISMALLAQGCLGLALQTTPSLIPNLTQAVFEECDMELARASMPADLKLMEGLLKSAPQTTSSSPPSPWASQGTGSFSWKMLMRSGPPSST